MVFNVPHDDEEPWGTLILYIPISQFSDSMGNRPHEDKGLTIMGKIGKSIPHGEKCLTMGKIREFSCECEIFLMGGKKSNFWEIRGIFLLGNKISPWGKLGNKLRMGNIPRWEKYLPMEKLGNLDSCEWGKLLRGKMVSSWGKLGNLIARSECFVQWGKIPPYFPHG